MTKYKTNHRNGHGFFVYPDPAKVGKQLHEQRHDLAPKKKQLVNVGGQGDCGFRALAAAMVDNIIANNRLHAKPNQKLSDANKEFCSRLLQQHLVLFPHYNEEVGEGLWTPVERLERMRHKQGFIPDLAFTLRQAAVDEIVAHPEDYRGAFVDYEQSEHPELTLDDQQTSPMIMRQLTTWIDESAIAAVANAFNVPVTVRVTEPNKELPKPLHYGPDATMSSLMQANKVEIQLEANHYQPLLTDPSAFATVISQSAFMQKAASTENEFHDPSLEEMLAKIKVADEKLVADFEEHRARLTALVDEGQLDKDLLLKIYIQGLNKPNNSGYLAGRMRHVGLEHGNQDFFARAVKNAKTDLSLTRSDPSVEFDKIICAEAVHAIARAMVTTHDLSPDEVYAEIKASSSSVSLR